MPSKIYGTAPAPGLQVVTRDSSVTPSGDPRGSIMRGTGPLPDFCRQLLVNRRLRCHPGRFLPPTNALRTTTNAYATDAVAEAFTSSSAFLGFVFFQNADLPLAYALQEFNSAKIASGTAVRLEFVLCAGTIRTYMGLPIHG